MKHNLSSRERAFWRRLNSTADKRAGEIPDLFRESAMAERRRHHLVFIIRRKAKALGALIDVADLVDLAEERLSAIRLSISERIALLKRLAVSEAM